MFWAVNYHEITLFIKHHKDNYHKVVIFLLAQITLFECKNYAQLCSNLLIICDRMQFLINYMGSHQCTISAQPCNNYNIVLCARLAQLVRSLTANQEVPGSSPGLVEG